MPDTNHTTIPALFVETASRLQDQVALRYKAYGLWHDITWKAYLDQVQSLTLALVDAGLTKGDRVAILGDNSPEWVIADLAIQCAGGISVGIYATNSWEQCQYIIDHAGCTFLFAENEEQLDKWLQFKDRSPHLKQVIFWDEEGLRTFEEEQAIPFQRFIQQGRSLLATGQARFSELVATIQPADTAFIVYTSGTTGPPKGAMLSHRNATWTSAQVAKIDQTLQFTEKDEVLSFLPLCHIFERLFSVLIPIRFGTVVNFVEDPDTVADNLKEVSPTVGYGVPRMWEKYHASVNIKMNDASPLKKWLYRVALQVGTAHQQAEEKNEDRSIFLRIGYALAHFAVFRKLKERLGFENMRLAISGAAPIAPDILRYFRSIGLNLVEGYGMTESCGVLTGVNAEKLKLGTVGTPMPGIALRVADDGELLAQSEGIFQGYYQDPEKTAVTLKDGWLHTGDIVEMDPDGFVKIIDRKKDLIITAGGKNIAPQYIENKLKCSAYITDAIVVGDRKKFLSALIVLDEDNITVYARENRISFSTYSELSTHEAINALIEKEVSLVNKSLARVENIRKFKILPKRLYQEDGEVTPTMKVKRTAINAMFGDLITEMYA